MADGKTLLELLSAEAPDGAAVKKRALDGLIYTPAGLERQERLKKREWLKDADAGLGIPEGVSKIGGSLYAAGVKSAVDPGWDLGFEAYLHKLRSHLIAVKGAVDERSCLTELSALKITGPALEAASGRTEKVIGTAAGILGVDAAKLDESKYVILGKRFAKWISEKPKRLLAASIAAAVLLAAPDVAFGPAAAYAAPAGPAAVRICAEAARPEAFAGPAAASAEDAVKYKEAAGLAKGYITDCLCSAERKLMQKPREPGPLTVDELAGLLAAEAGREIEENRSKLDESVVQAGGEPFSEAEAELIAAALREKVDGCCRSAAEKYILENKSIYAHETVLGELAALARWEAVSTLDEKWAELEAGAPCEAQRFVIFKKDFDAYVASAYDKAVERSIKQADVSGENIIKNFKEAFAAGRGGRMENFPSGALADLAEGIEAAKRQVAAKYGGAPSWRSNEVVDRFRTNVLEEMEALFGDAGGARPDEGLRPGGLASDVYGSFSGKEKEAALVCSLILDNAPEGLSMMELTAAAAVSAPELEPVRAAEIAASAAGLCTYDVAAGTFKLRRDGRAALYGELGKDSARYAEAVVSFMSRAAEAAAFIMADEEAGPAAAPCASLLAKARAAFEDVYENGLINGIDGLAQERFSGERESGGREAAAPLWSALPPEM